MVVELLCEQGCLRIVVNDDLWCRVEVVADGVVTPLGAETFGIFAARLSEAVSPERRGPGVANMDGPVRWVMSLSEHHGTIYAEDRGDTLWLLCEDDQGKVFATLQLSATDRLGWSGNLAAARSRLRAGR